MRWVVDLARCSKWKELSMIGFKTTAHTLCFVLGFLALYPNQQDNLYNHIKSVMPDGVIPVRLLTASDNPD